MIFSVYRVHAHEPANAERLAALRREAYAVEARWLGVTDFPPARVTAEDVAREPGESFVALREGEWLGAITLEPLPHGATLVAALVVAPAWHRKGVAAELLGHVVAKFGNSELVASTGAANVAACALYRRFGFVEGPRRTVGAEPVEVVELRRPPDPGTGGPRAAGPH